MTPLLGFLLGLCAGCFIGVFVVSTLQDDFHWRDWWIVLLIAVAFPAVLVITPYWWWKREKVRKEERKMAIAELKKEGSWIG